MRVGLTCTDDVLRHYWGSRQLSKHMFERETERETEAEG